MTLSRDRPEILTPPRAPARLLHPADHHRPDHSVAAKTRQKHDYPSPHWRRSYPRRTGAERTFATIKDPATTSIARGWCRLTGLTPLTLWIACLLAVRNQRILTACDARQEDDARRAAAGLPPRTRKRRRTSLASSPPGHLTTGTRQRRRGTHRRSNPRPARPPARAHTEPAPACPQANPATAQQPARQDHPG